MLFASGGFVIYLILECFDIKHKMIIAIFLGMLMACADEFHQLYSSNRGPKLFDVCIDTMGVITGVIIATISCMIIKKIYNKLENRRKVHGKF